MSIADLLLPCFLFFYFSFLPFSLQVNNLGETAGCAIGKALETNTTLTALRPVMIVFSCVCCRDVYVVGKGSTGEKGGMVRSEGGKRGWQIV